MDDVLLRHDFCTPCGRLSSAVALIRMDDLAIAVGAATRDHGLTPVAQEGA